jgi:transcriptional regulator GlxA family with amidase domain
MEQIYFLMKQTSKANNVSALSRHTGLSMRCLQRLFMEHIGVPPKRLSNILRFQKSEKLLKRSDEPYTTIAYQRGYDDQAHFVREFKTFSADTPAAYRMKNNAINLSYLSNG